MSAVLLSETRLANIQPGSLEWFQIQREIIRQKPLVQRTYDAWYHEFLRDEASVPTERQGVLLELGSGASYLKELLPGLVTSDVIDGVADRRIDARSIPFENESVRAIFISHTFHHIPDVAKFLEEAQRVLVKGGVIAMTEPASTPFARFFYRHFHDEPYEMSVREWSFQSSHSMDSNQALSHIVFVRDRAIFEKRFPHLRIERFKLFPWLGYFLSGGVTRRSMVPRQLAGAVGLLDRLSAPFHPLFALHWHVTIRKT